MTDADNWVSFSEKVRGIWVTYLKKKKSVGFWRECPKIRAQKVGTWCIP